MRIASPPNLIALNETPSTSALDVVAKDRCSLRWPCEIVRLSGESIPSVRHPTNHYWRAGAGMQAETQAAFAKRLWEGLVNIYKIFSRDNG